MESLANLVESFFTLLLTEYGALVTFELLVIIALGLTVLSLWKDAKASKNELLGAFVKNTEVITQLVERLKEHD